MGTLNVNLLGSSFILQTNEDDSYMKKLFGYYEKITDEINKSGMLKDATQTAIVAGIMICDELYKEKSKNAKLLSSNPELQNITLPEDAAEIEERTLQMIKKISQVL